MYCLLVLPSHGHYRCAPCEFRSGLMQQLQNGANLAHALIRCGSKSLTSPSASRSNPSQLVLPSRAEVTARPGLSSLPASYNCQWKFSQSTMRSRAQLKTAECCTRLGRGSASGVGSLMTTAPQEQDLCRILSAGRCTTANSRARHSNSVLAQVRIRTLLRVS